MTQKITKSYLQRIINEETKKLLEEGPTLGAASYNKRDDDEGSFADAGEEIHKHGTEGVFTEKADLHNMTVAEFARHVLDHIGDYSDKTDHEAEFAKGAETVARHHDEDK